MRLNVLVLGGGGREHALAWGLAKSPLVGKTFAAPGNPGIAEVATCLPVDLGRPEDVFRIIQENDIGLTVVGPEAPLVAGLADALREKGKAVFGPGARAARLEGSKAFAKKFMTTHGLPTAAYRDFSSAQDAKAFVESRDWPGSFRVVKADGLAAGKGVVVAADRAEVLNALDTMMVRRAFGDAGSRVVIEELMTGEELSVMALCDGKTLVPLLPTQDHKRVFDGDAGPNTGGMGAYGPVPLVTSDTWKAIETTVFDRFLVGLAAENLVYRGVIYFGLMLTPAGPQLLEFNVRFGDPETQVILPMGDVDWAELFLATAEGRLSPRSFRAKPGVALTVVMASGGYPGEFQKGQKITGLDASIGDDSLQIFHAGTSRNPQGDWVTAGGRVLAVTARAADLEAARARAYSAVKKIQFTGAHFRTDIARRALLSTGSPV